MAVGWGWSDGGGGGVTGRGGNKGQLEWPPQ